MKPPKATSESVSRSMRSNRSSGTKPELALAKLLRKRLYRNGLPGNPDFIYPKKKLAVFVHGCFWHRCPRCKFPVPKSNTEYWRDKFSRNVKRDALAVKSLRKMGWRSMVVWEHDVKKDPRKAAKKIRSTGSEPPIA